MRSKLPTIAGIAVLLVVVAACWKSSGVKAQGTMHTMSIPDASLMLVGQADHEFDPLVTALLGGPDPDFETLKPYSVVLYNRSNKTLVAYNVRWEFTRPNGNRIHVSVSDGRIQRLLDGGMPHEDPTDDRQSPSINRQSWAIVTPAGVKKTNFSTAVGASRTPDWSAIQPMISRFSQATDLEVSLDGAFFEDGSFVRPNRSGFFETFKSQVNAQQALVSYIVHSAGEGRTVDDVAREVQASLPASHPQLASSSDGSTSGFDEFFSYKYSSEFLAVYRSSDGKGALAWARYQLFQHLPILKKK